MKRQIKCAACIIFLCFISLDLLAQFCRISGNIEGEKDNNEHNFTDTKINTSVLAEWGNVNATILGKMVTDNYTSISGWNLLNTSSLEQESDETELNPEELFCLTFLLACNMLGLIAIKLDRPLLLIPWLVVYAIVFFASYTSCFFVFAFKENYKFFFTEATFSFINGFCINLNWIFILKTFLLMRNEQNIE